MVSKEVSPRKISGVISGCLSLKSLKASKRVLSSSGDFAFFNGNIRMRIEIVLIIKIN